MKIISILFTFFGIIFAIPKNTRIIGGEEADPHTLPYQVFLTLHDDNDVWFCGGTLISPSTVLTAAQCCDGALLAEIVLGAHKPFEVEEHQVVLNSYDILVHSEFQMFPLLNDIAIIRLPAEIELNDFINTIPLEDSNSGDRNGSATISGWGFTSNDNLSPVLMIGSGNIITNSQCAAYYNFIEPSHVCFAAESTSPCIGDYGGPLTADGILIGIISYIEMGCFPNFPSVYTRISSFIQWIQQNS